MIKSQDLNKFYLPATPGVYLFKQKGLVLYIGKATSLKDRVKSYFSNDLMSTRGPLLADLIYKANKVDYIKTNSVLEALILESNLIKKYQPKYNTKEKDDRSFNFVIITKEDFPRIIIMRGRKIEKDLPYKIKDKFGPFTNGELLRNGLKIIRKIFPFRDKCEPNSGRPCFNRQIGLCPGVCDGLISKSEYGKLVRKIRLFFSGKTDNLKKNLIKEMKVLAKGQKFEKAHEVKRQIFALNHIQDVALISAFPALDKAGWHSDDGAVEKIRIESYDVAHLSGTNNVGVMVVMENGELKKNDYRKFNIKESRGNDIGALKEILKRRLKHKEWPSPDLIVVDGGLAQLNIAKEMANMIPILAVTKNDKHKPKAIIGDEKLVKKYKKEILLINNEAHRFAIAFHRQKRNAII